MISMETFDEVKKEAFRIEAGEILTLKRIREILSPYKGGIKEQDFNKIIEELISVTEGLKDIRDIVERIYKKAVIDPLGIFSRVYFDEVSKDFENMRHLAFLIGDVDKFHDYNDLYGHPQGDLALRSIARTFKTSIEDQLVKDEVAFTARYGGEEFCSFIRNYQRGDQELVIVGENVLQSIRSLEIAKSTEAKCPDEGYKHRTMTLAAGIRKEEESLSSLIHRVDDLLKSKNKGGRNRVYLRP